MTPSPAVIGLSILIVTMALAAAAAGLFWQLDPGPATVTSVRGETVELYGEGLYRHDTMFKGAANRGTDAVTLALAVPLLALSTVLYRRGSARGALLLTGVLTWFLYVYASLALGIAYNELFLVYVALFGMSLYALASTIRSIDVHSLDARLAGPAPRRGLALLMAVSGVVTVGVWLGPLVGSMFQGDPPGLLGHSTTMVTDALDLAIIAPAALLAAVLLSRREPLGWMVALPLLLLLLALFPMIVAQTFFQQAAGVSFTPGEIAGPVGGFLLLGSAAFWFVVSILRNAR